MYRSGIHASDSEHRRLWFLLRNGEEDTDNTGFHPAAAPDVRTKEQCEERPGSYLSASLFAFRLRFFILQSSFLAYTLAEIIACHDPCLCRSGPTCATNDGEPGQDSDEPFLSCRIMSYPVPAHSQADQRRKSITCHLFLSISSLSQFALPSRERNRVQEQGAQPVYLDNSIQVHRPRFAISFWAMDILP